MLDAQDFDADWVTVLQATLRGLFKSYGDVLDVVAHGNMRMRGQAFVSFDSVDSARKAMKDVQRFPLYSKPMVRCSIISTIMFLINHLNSKLRLQRRGQTLW